MQKAETVSLDHIEDANEIVRDVSLRRERLLVKFLVESLLDVPSFV